MNISMVGIDFHTAGIEQRERYALTKEKAAALGMYFVRERVAQGCVILATCNRTEVWFSGLIGTPREQFFQAIAEDGESLPLFREREGREAIRYLMELGCGIHSQIFGEDQILSQLKQAMELARAYHYADSVLETLFRQAVTAAKKVKSTVRLTLQNRSVPQGALELLSRTVSDWKKKSALVIGNGEMGRMMAQLLVKQGADVTMTLRQYKTFDAVIPEGVKVVLYEERYDILPEMNIVVSATLSPHYTIRKDAWKGTGKRCILVDLAVPRDIDPEISRLPNVTLYDMDRLGMAPRCEEARLVKAGQILEGCIEEFERWYACRGLMPDIQCIGKQVGELTDAKLTRVYQSIPLYGEEEVKLRENVQRAVEKSLTKLILTMRERMEEEAFSDCLSALRDAAGKLPV